jgi:tetratricopeptide (TPR) repeat protein
MKVRNALLYSLTAFVALTVEAFARQDNMDRIGVGDPGSASITGRVMLPSGLATGSHIKMVLSNFQAPLVTIYADKNGEFNFTNLRAGTYYVRVLADEEFYEPLIQQVKLKPGEPGHLVLYLKEKKGPVVKQSRGNVISIAEDDGAVPASARKAFDLAHKMIDKGDIDGAITKLNEAVTLHPDYVIARNDLGAQYLKRKRFTEAADQFKIILEKNPKYFNARLNLGLVLVEQKRFSEAIEELSEAVALDSSQPAAHLFWGIAALDLNDLEVAERELVKALLLGGPQYSTTHYYFAHIYLKTGRREEAGRELALFLKTAPHGEMAAQARALLQQLKDK